MLDLLKTLNRVAQQSLFDTNKLQDILEVHLHITEPCCKYDHESHAKHFV